MKHLNKIKRNNTIGAAATLLTLAFFLVAGPGTIIGINQSADAIRDAAAEGIRTESKAPVVVSGDNIYIAWWNGTAGEPDIQTDVMFRASNDGGATFSDKINLSNTTDADSWRVELHGEGDTVVVSWWESNQTSDVPVARISTDAGETFGPMLMLAANGTISSTEEEEEEGETVEEEAVGGEEVAE
jgi:hypothetical protein